jgi:hypothetical protein
VEEKLARDEQARRAARLKEIEAEIKRLQGEAEELTILAVAQNTHTAGRACCPAYQKNGGY